MPLTQRSQEDSYWRTQNGHAQTGNGGFGSKLEGYGFGDKRELPMYKDKPYNYAGSKRKTPFHQQWRVIGGALLGVIALAYWFGIFSSYTNTPTRESKRKISWNWLGGQEPAVDWDERREKVKDAFMLSWDGYEQNAWGMLRSCQGLSTNLVFSYRRQILRDQYQM